MKIWQVTHHGEPEEMVLAEIDPPVPVEGEVLIRNRACGLNFFDMLQCQGKYQSRPAFPFTIGAEVAGVVAAVGPDVAKPSPGDRVLSLPRGGGFAEYTWCRRRARIPYRIQCRSSRPRACRWCTRLRCSHSTIAPVSRPASGCSCMPAQAAWERPRSSSARRWAGHVIATAGSAEKLEFCTAQGADHVLGYRDAAWVDEVKRICGRFGADVIYDPVGGDVFDLSSKVIAPGGRLLVIGFASGRIPR